MGKEETMLEERAINLEETIQNERAKQVEKTSDNERIIIMYNERQ